MRHLRTEQNHKETSLVYDHDVSLCVLLKYKQQQQKQNAEVTPAGVLGWTSSAD